MVYPKKNNNNNNNNNSIKNIVNIHLSRLRLKPLYQKKSLKPYTTSHQTVPS